MLTAATALSLICAGIEITRIVRGITSPRDLEGLYKKACREVTEEGFTPVTFEEASSYFARPDVRQIVFGAFGTNDSTELEHIIDNDNGAKAELFKRALVRFGEFLEDRTTIGEKLIIEGSRRTQQELSEFRGEVTNALTNVQTGQNRLLANDAEIIETLAGLERKVAGDEGIEKEVRDILTQNLREAKEEIEVGEITKAETRLHTIRPLIDRLGPGEKGDYHNLRSCVYIQLGDFRNAVYECRTALEYDPLTKYLLNLAVSLIACGTPDDLPEANRILNNIEEDEKADPKYLYAMGSYYFYTGELEEAATAFLEAYETDNTELRSLFNYAGTLLKQDRYDKYDEIMGRLSEDVKKGTTSKQFKTHYYYGMGFRRVLEFKNDSRIFTTSVDEDIILTSSLDYCDPYRASLEEAVGYFDIALGYAEGNVLNDILVNKSFCLIALGRNSEARTILETLLADRNLPEENRKVAHYNLGDVYRIEGAFDAAVGVYESAIEDFGRSYGNRVLLGAAYLGWGPGDIFTHKRTRKDIEKGLELLEGCIAEKPTDKFVTNNLSVTYLLLKEPERAEGLLNTLLAEDENDFSALINYGRLEYERSNYRSAGEYFDRAVNIKPGSSKARFLRASARGYDLIYNPPFPEHNIELLGSSLQKERYPIFASESEVVLASLTEFFDDDDVSIRFDALNLSCGLKDFEARLAPSSSIRDAALEEAISYCVSITAINELPSHVKRYFDNISRAARSQLGGFRL